MCGLASSHPLAETGLLLVSNVVRAGPPIPSSPSTHLGLLNVWPGASLPSTAKCAVERRKRETPEITHQPRLPHEKNPVYIAKNQTRIAVVAGECSGTVSTVALNMLRVAGRETACKLSTLWVQVMQLLRREQEFALESAHLEEPLRGDTSTLPHCGDVAGYVQTNGLWGRSTWHTSKIELGDVTPHNIKQLKRLNQVIFPVSYNDKFYKDVLEAGELAKLGKPKSKLGKLLRMTGRLCFAAYYNDIVVGAVCCRIDTSENSRRLYIMTLGVLYPYRRLGIASKMLEHVLNYVQQDCNFDSIFLHVQVNNEGAIEFYKKFGFEIVETKEHYYKRIEPAEPMCYRRLCGQS
ncbi:hypothetical protein PR048_007448 [Dryococelus australis]|uniref:N-terminal methionine N(alpha)-acetyltransferase NatE n=1 Tax=Dryococelus australis TaxID=614101 RepID=A0ABQ9HV64_9NEOP|nr:hypothetical protein PR048_007448 [Dryococelus australis]